MIAASSLRASPLLCRSAAQPQRVQRRALVVRASVEPPTTNEAETPAAPAAVPTSAKATTLSASDIMAFSGPAPEIVNGRLAMLAVTSAIAAELASGESVLQQLFTPSAEPWIIYTVVLFIGASIIPIAKGAKSEAFGPFSPKAELLNGRLAMLGFASLLLVEAFKGTALF